MTTDRPSQHAVKRGKRLAASFKLSLELAVDATAGRHATVHPTTQRWIAVRVAQYERFGDTFLKTFKRILSEVFTADMSGLDTSHSIRGQVLPRCLIAVKGEKLWQYCKVRRCLPRPNRNTIQAAERVFIDNITKDVPKSPPHNRVVERLKAHGNRFRVLHAPELKPQHIVGGSGCAEFRRRDGGRNAALSSLTPSRATYGFVEDRALAGALLPYGALPERLRECVEQFREEFPLPDTVDMQVSMVAELGCKTRGVTKSPTRVVAEAHAYREMLWPIIVGQKHIVTSEALRDPELAEIDFGPIKTTKDLRVFSADFSDATSSMTHESLQVFCEAFNVPPKLVFEGHCISGRPVTQGCPMGLPLSWTALTIVHNAICEVVDPKRHYRLKGDDLIALWTLAQIELYKALAASVGLVVNEKTIISHSCGTFCEGDYRLVYDVVRKHVVLARVATFSLRTFASDNPLASDMAERFIERGVSRDLLISLQRRYHKRWINLCSGMGVNPYAPRRFGGLGLVSKPDHCLDKLTCRIVNASNNGTLVFSDDDAVNHYDLTGKVMAVVNSVKWKVDRPSFTERFEQLAYGAVAQATLLDYLGYEAPAANALTPGKLVRSLRAYRRRFVAAKIRTVCRKTTVSTAYSVLSRLVVPEEELARVTVDSRHIRLFRQSYS